MVTANSDRPKQSYHGTQTAIHLLPHPFLDPQFATGGDEGDPQQPHVFVTPNRLLAKIFALKAPNVIGISTSSNGGSIIFSSEPQNVQGGWLYTCPENPARPFQETVAHGQPTGKWVSFDNVPITQPEFIPGLKEIAQQDGLQVYVLKEGIDIKNWLNARNDAAYKGQVDAFTEQQIALGNLHHLNREWNTSKLPSALKLSTRLAPTPTITDNRFYSTAPLAQAPHNALSILK